jgi:hypothetical protein
MSYVLYVHICHIGKHAACWPVEIGARFVIADTDRVRPFCNQAVVGFLLTLNWHTLTYPKKAKPQIHKATKREKRHRTSDLGSRGTASRSAIAQGRDNILAPD